MRVRNWIFTLNNPQRQLTWEDPVTYAVWQLERVTTAHYQGYVELSAPKSLSQMISLLPSAHWEPRKGTQEQAITYCTKTVSRVDGPWEFGKPKSQGKRTDLMELKQMIEDGSSERQILDQHYGTWLRYAKNIRHHIRLIQPLRNWKTEVYVVVGPPGTGKSHWANEQDTNAYFKQRSNWWDGYESHDTVVLDDFYAWLPYDLLLRICDKWPLLVETKGGQTNFTAKKVIITSNQEPDEWYPNIKNFGAFERRVEHWIRFVGKQDFIERGTFKEFKNLTKIKPEV